MNYNLMPLKYFIDVVQTHGFSSAAKRNFVSETAVSAAISKLERDLGHKLLIRSANHLSLTPVGKIFYERAVDIVNSYNAIWHHPDSHPEKMLRIHFLPGMGNDAAITRKLLSNYEVMFDEVSFTDSVNQLIDNECDIVVGFELVFVNNAKIQTYPLRAISFDLLFNQKQLGDRDPKKVARKSTLYLQNWQSSGIDDIQSAMLDIFCNQGWSYGQTAKINGFAAACLNVSTKGGFTMVPEDFVIPKDCENIYRISPDILYKKFQTVMAININNTRDLGSEIVSAIC